MRIKNRGKINLLDLNIYSETFFAELMNYLLGYNLENINAIKQNAEGSLIVPLLVFFLYIKLTNAT